ncbi:MAG: GNAT family N-acetyltransferase [Bacteroidota bacterium]
MANFTLHSPRLHLPVVASSDAAFLHQCFTDPFVRKYLWDDTIIERSLTHDIIEQNAVQFDKERCGLWKVVHAMDRVTMGIVGLWYFFEEAQPQLIYALFERFCGQGFATEAAKRIVQYAFDELEFAYLDAACDAPHLNSQKVAERLGMDKRLETEVEGKATVFFRLNRSSV